MSILTKEAYGPIGDPAFHLELGHLEKKLRALPPLPTESGVLMLIVRRLSDGEREAPVWTRLTPEEGVPGDGWTRRPPRDREAQLAVMRHDIAELIANGQPLTLFGDNLLVAMDLSAANLPVGTRLAVGDAVVEMTAKPHNGCSKFKTRFGTDALSLVGAEPTRHMNLRGVYWRVVEAGDVSVGATVRVLSRAARTAARVTG